MTMSQRHKAKAIIIGGCLANDQALAQQLLTLFGVDVPTTSSTAKHFDTSFWDHILDTIENGEYRHHQQVFHNVCFWK